MSERNSQSLLNYPQFYSLICVIILISFIGCSKDYKVVKPENTKTWMCNEHADGALKNGDYESGISLHQRILAAEPKNSLAMYHLGYALGCIGDHKQEVYYYEKAISHGYNQDNNLYYNLGMAYGELDMPAKAVFAFKSAIDINPTSADSHFGLALAYEANINFKLAEDEYLKAIKIDPKHLDARMHLSILYTDMGDLQKACDQLKKILEIDPTNESARKFLENIEKE